MNKHAPLRSPASPWKLALIGVAMALVATFVTYALGDMLLGMWEAGRDLSIYPEGSEYAFLSLAFRPLLDFPMFLLVFAGLVPFVYADHRRIKDRKPIVAWRLALIGACLASLLSAAIGSLGGPVLVVVVAGPVFLSAAVGVLVLTDFANRELTR